MNVVYSIPDWIRYLVATGAVGWIQSGILLSIGLVLCSSLKRFGPKLQTLVGRIALIMAIIVPIISLFVGSYQWNVINVDIPSVWRHEASPITLPSDLPDIRYIRYNNQLQERNFNLKKETEGNKISVSHIPLPSDKIDIKVSNPKISYFVFPYAFVIVIWLIGVCLLIVRLYMSYQKLQYIIQNAQGIDTISFMKYLRVCKLELLFVSPVLRVSNELHSPILIGVKKPTIVLPEQLLNDISGDQLNAIYVHEISHLKRKDCLWRWISSIGCIFGWMQPLFGRMSSRLEEISEIDCDNAVVASMYPPKAYANLLLSFAERWRPQPEEALLGAGLLPYRSELRRRIEEFILHPQRIWFGVSIWIRSIIQLAGCIIGALITLAVIGAGTPNKSTSYNWAKRQGWDIGNAVYPIDTHLLPHYRANNNDLRLLDPCLRKYRDVEAKNYRDISYKKFLTEYLTIHPHYYYAEYLLAVWYFDNGDKDQYSKYLDLSLHDAPVVIAGRVRMLDGTPLAHLELSKYIYLDSPVNNKWGWDAAIAYPIIITDNEGCFYLPICKGVYSTGGNDYNMAQLETIANNKVMTSSVMGYDAPYYTIPRNHVCILPDNVISPQLNISIPTGKGNGTLADPIVVHGDNVPIVWNNYPGHPIYHVRYVQRWDNQSDNSTINVYDIWPSRSIADGQNLDDAKSGINIRHRKSIYGDNEDLKTGELYKVKVFVHDIGYGNGDLTETESNGLYFKVLN